MPAHRVDNEIGDYYNGHQMSCNQPKAKLAQLFLTVPSGPAPEADRRCQRAVNRAFLSMTEWFK
jgi:hypothetical protein